MSIDIQKFKELQRNLIYQEKKRLGILQDSEVQHVDTDDENEQQTTHTSKEAQNVESHDFRQNFETHATQSLNSQRRHSTTSNNDCKQNAPLVERLNLSCNEASLEKEKQAFIDKLINSENPLTFRSYILEDESTSKIQTKEYILRQFGHSDDKCQSTMLRYGEYSPNNPLLRVAAAPYLGVGEYEQRRLLLLKQRKADYKEHVNKRNEQIKNTAKNILIESRPTSGGLSKSVQTDIQNINNKLVQYESNSDNITIKDTSPESANSNKENRGIYSNTSSNVQRIDQRLTSLQNGLVQSEMDKPRSILSNRRTESPRERLLSDLQHAYVPSFMDGFSYHDRTDDIQRERVKRESYQQELRMQIEEKRRLTEMREEHERREQERENRRFEQQLIRMQEEQMWDDQRRNRRDEQSRRNSEEYLRRKQELQVRPSYRKHLESESSTLSLRNTNVASKLSHYSPPISRRNHYSYTVPASSSSSYVDPPIRYGTNRYDTLSRKDALNRMDSLNVRDASNSRDNYSRFSRYDSLSRIDSLKQDTLNRLETLSINDSLNRVQRRHSATQQDLSLIRRSPKMQRRCSSSRLDDPLPIPVLKAHSPVARELKNSVAVNSSWHTSDAVRKLEDKWQIPAVQKNIINHGDLLTEGHGRSILTQLGAIRMQLQQEQLRMDETLRQRSNTQSKAVNFH